MVKYEKCCPGLVLLTADLVRSVVWCKVEKCCPGLVLLTADLVQSVVCFGV